MRSFCILKKKYAFERKGDLCLYGRNKRDKGEDKMKRLKEWLSDYLRYFMLILAAGLLFIIIMIGVKVYQRYDSETSGQNIEILKEGGKSKKGSGTLTEDATKEQSEKTTENVDQKVPGNDGQKAETLPVQSEQATKSDAMNDNQSAGNETEGQTQPLTQPQTQVQSETQVQPQTQPPTEPEPATQAPTEPPTEQPTEPPTEPQPVYKTMIGTCNFRSGPGYEYEVMAEYPAGTVVEYLGLVEGWSQVRIDGVIGYMGPRFLE
jgi:hypothetical protein